MITDWGTQDGEACLGRQSALNYCLIPNLS